jgi:hypothetical protein
MLLAMLAVMLRRRDHYGYRRPARRAAHAAEAGVPGTADLARPRAGSTALDATESRAAVL